MTAATPTATRFDDCQDVAFDQALATPERLARYLGQFPTTHTIQECCRWFVAAPKASCPKCGLKYNPNARDPYFGGPRSTQYVTTPAYIFQNASADPVQWASLLYWNAPAFRRWVHADAAA